MFRRFTDRMASALSAATGTGSGDVANENEVARLMNMGFGRDQAVEALRNSSGNVEEAAEWLLVHATSSSLSPGMVDTAADIEQRDLQKAIGASLQDSKRPSDRTRSAASVRAGQAAVARFDGSHAALTAQPTLEAKIPSQSHPGVKVPKKLSQHDNDDVIMRCAQRVASNSTVVDTLLRSFRQVQSDSTNMKFRSIDTSTIGFQKSLSFPGSVDFFHAMGYHPRPSNPKVLELSYVDHATLYLGVSALEQVQENSPEYKQHKAQMLFDAEIQQQLDGAGSDETAKRAAFQRKLPSEPTTAAGQISIELGPSRRVKRKFDGDDCLEDVLRFLGTHASIIPEKLERNEWFLVNRNYAEPIAYNIQELKTKTLQYIGCWPSGRLAVVPLPPKSSNDHIASRGLGAAPVNLLKL